MTKNNFPFDQSVSWTPKQKWIEESNLMRFMKQNQIVDYNELMKKSTEDIEWFWDAVMQDLDIQFYEPYKQIVDLSNGIQNPEWCVGAKMNIIHNCLDKWTETIHKNSPAVYWENEKGICEKMSYLELNQQVCKCANALRSLGIQKGDVIALYMPMIPELLVAFLATAKIGAVILPLFSGYGPQAIQTRLNDSGAKVVFTIDGMLRRGKLISMKSNIDEILTNVPTLKHIIVKDSVDLDLNQSTLDHDWNELVDVQSYHCETEQTLAEDVLMIIYTSGTTGKPKGAVHTHCGFPVKAAQDLFHCMDLKPRDTLYWMTDMGWMMGPWEVFGTLLIGSKMVFYDGAPDYPNKDRLWELVRKYKVSHLGISPPFIRNSKVNGTELIKNHDLSCLRMVGSTGSPWDSESWNWVFENVLKKEKPIINYSGGTEISGGIVCGNFFKPLKPCAFSDAVPGMDIDVFDSKGNSIKNQVGELVIKKPWIGMSRGFWKDPERYLETYWTYYEGVWRHGDYAAVDNDGLWYILGRSDDTLKVAGKRLGPAEVESILNGHPSIIDSAVIGLPDNIKDEEIVGYCVLNDQYIPSQELKNELIQLLVHHLGKPLKPRDIRFVKALPKTRNGKLMRRLIKAICLNKDLGDISSMENTDVLDYIQKPLPLLYVKK